LRVLTANLYLVVVVVPLNVGHDVVVTVAKQANVAGLRKSFCLSHHGVPVSHLVEGGYPILVVVDLAGVFREILNIIPLVPVPLFVP
jgi:hypothetical protein